MSGCIRATKSHCKTSNNQIIIDSDPGAKDMLSDRGVKLDDIPFALTRMAGGASSPSRRSVTSVCVAMTTASNCSVRPSAEPSLTVTVTGPCSPLDVTERRSALTHTSGSSARIFFTYSWDRPYGKEE